METIQRNSFFKRIVLLLMLIMLLASFLPNYALAVNVAEDEISTRAAIPEPNWGAPEPGNPNYWPIPEGSTIGNTNLAFIGLRYNGVTQNSIQLTMPTTLSATSITLKNVQFKIDNDLMPYVKEVRARSFIWLVEGVPSAWRTLTPVPGEEGVFQVPFFWVNQGLFPAINAGVFNQFHVPVEIILKDGYTTANIPQEPYVVQMRVNAERRGRNIVAWESMGKGTVVLSTPTTGNAVSNWLSKPAIMGAEYNAETNILRYFWRGNPIVTYRVASIDLLPGRNKPYVFNVVADPAIIEASEQLEVYAHNLTGREGPHFVMDKNKLESVFNETSIPGYRSAKITPDNNSVSTVDNYIYQDAGGPDVPVYTIMEFKINPEKLFVEGDNNYHINAPIKTFFTEKLNSSQRLIKHSAAENFFMISKTFYLPEVNDVFTEDKVVTGYTYSGDMFVKVTLPSGEVLTGRSAEDPDDSGKYPFSIALPENTELLKGQEIKVQNAEKGKALSNPVVETVNARITFNNNYPNAPANVVVEANDDKNINTLGELMPEKPTREGFVFAGWFENEDGTGEEFTKDTVIEKSKTVYAKWVNEPSVKPINLKQEYINEKQIITGSFENGAKPDLATSEVILVDESGKPILGSNGEPIKGKINPDGTFEFPIDDLKHDDKVKVQLTEKDKLPTISDETLTIDKLGPNITVIKAESNENFININAKVDEPDATVVVEVGNNKYPVTLDSEGNFTITLPKDLEGEIVIVATDVLGNKSEEIVNKDTFDQQPIDIRGKKPYAGNFTFTAYAGDGVTAKINFIRDNVVLETQEEVVRNGRVTFVLKEPLQVNDVITLQGIYKDYYSEPITYKIDN